ncbi:MAG: hypothetical protein HOV79_34545 [Hamadaea sp.]|nr:hypothetical protein [Hamadaea sp.]
MVSQAVLLWSLLALFAVYATGWLLIPGVRQHARDARKLREASVLRRERLTTLATESTRYAGEIAVAADRAAIREARQREAWHRAQAELQTAEAAFDQADATWRRLALASEYPDPEGSFSDDESRARYLRRLLTEACIRGDLSPLVLSDALAGRDGWSAVASPAEQELRLSKVVREARRAVHRRAADRERAAWQAYVGAADQARALRAEAHAAQERAQSALALIATVRVPAARAATGPAWDAPTQILRRS